MNKSLSLSVLVFALIYLLALPWHLPIAWILKILPIAVLALAVGQTDTVPNRPILFAALLFSACGDVLLESDWFIAGVAAFLVAQLCYALLFFLNRQGFGHRWPGSLVLTAYMITMAILLIPQLGDLTIPVMVYLTVIGVMGLLALQSQLALRWAVLGALVFITSDSLIAVDKFLLPLPLSSVWIMVTYYAAQWLLIQGFISARSDR